MALLWLRDGDLPRPRRAGARRRLRRDRALLSRVPLTDAGTGSSTDHRSAPADPSGSTPTDDRHRRAR